MESTPSKIGIYVQRQPISKNIHLFSLQFTAVEIPTTKGPEKVGETENTVFDPTDGAKDAVELLTWKKPVILNIPETVIDTTRRQPDRSDEN